MRAKPNEYLDRMGIESKIIILLAQASLDRLALKTGTKIIGYENDIETIALHEKILHKIKEYERVYGQNAYTKSWRETLTSKTYADSQQK